MRWRDETWLHVYVLLEDVATGVRTGESVRDRIRRLGEDGGISPEQAAAALRRLDAAEESESDQ